MKHFIILLTFLLVAISVQAQNLGEAFEEKTLHSTILKMDRQYSIYLPAGYNSSDRSYPVLYLLHPAGPRNTIPDQRSWFYYGGLKKYLDSSIANGDMEPMIVVTPDANYGSKRISYFNDPEGDFSFEDFFFKELIPHIEENYRCRTEKDSRAIAGASLGGAAVLQYALHQPDKFSVVCALSGAVRKYDKQYLKGKFPNVSEKVLIDWYKPYDVYSYFENLSTEKVNEAKWYISCGDDDYLSPNNVMLHTLLKNKGVEHEFRIQNGAHDWSYWRNVMPEFMTFISDSFRK
ncbi:alpha/beta hydrolase-fold protein [uncultured Maribacter sp.]|uniref:alpha/beta hydrolase n=1 Tax=uncultured Maribacter sp. TaxID=431308 RepID=UPI0030DD65D1|tara:strand:+ start:2761 stop:3630 length:870 start_codon:yes stop_codon:yes gene_type:complete